MSRIKIAQPAVALNAFTFGKRANAILEKNRAPLNVPARRFNMGPGFTFDIGESEDIGCVLSYVASIAQREENKKLESLVINCHGNSGCFAIGNKIISLKNVSVFSILKGLVNKIYIVACKVASESVGKAFCCWIAVHSGATVYAAQKKQVGVPKIFSTHLPIGEIDGFEGKVFQFEPTGTYSLSNL